MSSHGPLMLMSEVLITSQWLYRFLLRIKIMLSHLGVTKENLQLMMPGEKYIAQFFREDDR